MRINDRKRSTIPRSFCVAAPPRTKPFTTTCRSRGVYRILLAQACAFMTLRFRGACTHFDERRATVDITRGLLRATARGRCPPRNPGGLRRTAGPGSLHDRQNPTGLAVRWAALVAGALEHHRSGRIHGAPDTLLSTARVWLICGQIERHAILIAPIENVPNLFGQTGACKWFLNKLYACIKAALVHNCVA
jgi:hypothetical protein